MTLPGDYHVHTTWSDGRDAVEACVRRAVELGLPEMATAEHFSPSPGPEDDWWLRPEELGAYFADVRAVGARHGDFTLLVGLEAEYVAGREAELEKHLSAWPFQVVVLGIHEVDGFVFDAPAARSDPRWDDADAVFTAYYRTVARAAEWGRFDVLAHLDYVGLWGHQPSPGVRREIEAALDALAACGAAIELNTDRFSDPAGVMYPLPRTLRLARARGIPLTIGSDAHHADHVGRALDEAIALACDAGYRETLRLSDGATVPLPEV